MLKLIKNQSGGHPSELVGGKAIRRGYWEKNLFAFHHAQKEHSKLTCSL
jgi:hypothetical protein